MKKILLIPALCILCVSCNGNSNDRHGHSKDCSSGNCHMKSQPSDWDITASVKKSLMTGNSLSANARMVSVTTNNGVVTLTGTVASKEESHKVARIAKQVPGVKSVDNQLTIAS